jgi:hypothetical protein
MDPSVAAWAASERSSRFDLNDDLAFSACLARSRYNPAEYLTNAMDEHTMETTGKVWAKTHPHEVDRIRGVVEMFAIKKCHENRPEDKLCPDCFREFIRLAIQEDAPLAGSMAGGGYESTRAWLRGVLS